MEKIRVVIAGFGNVGRGVLASIRNNPDMELVGVVSRSPERVKKELADIPVMPIADSEAWLAAFRPDVAILCGGSKNDLPKQGPMMAKLVNTVDSFDNHSRIPEYFAEMDAAAKAAGWQVYGVEYPVFAYRAEEMARLCGPERFPFSFFSPLP